MNTTMDLLVQRLESALGGDTVRSSGEDLARYTVDGEQPAVVCLPDGVDQVATALRLCVEAGAGTAPWGGGTAIQIGNLPRRIDAVIALKRLDGLVEHDHANLTATVQSGMTLESLQGILAKEKQFLAWDIPFPARSSIGGIVAANLNGFRRNYYGSVRDLVVGMKVVLTTGEQIKAGGKVVKNVAGYDMCKLFVGSLGTLGIITEVTVRMAPVPLTSATLVAYGSLPQAAQLVEEISRSVLQPAAVVIVNSVALTKPDQQWAAAIRTDGFEETVSRHLKDAGAMAERFGLGGEVLREHSHERFWNEIRDFQLSPDNLIYRLNLPRASAIKMLQACQEWRIGNLSPTIINDVSAGLAWLVISAKQADAVNFAKVTALAREHSGHAVLFAAPPEFKKGIDVWGPPPPSVSIMKEIKRQFDPQGLLNPGRFVAGI